MPTSSNVSLMAAAILANVISSKELL